MEIFTQCAAVLFDRVPSLEQLALALGGWDVSAKQEPAPGDGGWITCGAGLVIELRSGSSILVDLAAHPWPDDPCSGPVAGAIAAAWRSGTFGPTASPGALARARQQTWAWPAAAAMAGRHAAFVRLRTIVRLPDEAPQLPRNHDPLHELGSLTELAGAILRVEGATALFFPAGEALRSPAMVREVLGRKTGLGSPPLEIWTNLRAVGLGEDAGARWVLADVVGMRQLRLPDQEAIYADGQEQPDAVAALLTNACLHLASGKGIPDGSTSDDGRSRRWRASSVVGVLAPAKREVVRWLPEQSAKPGAALLARLRPPEPA
jgi:hypothetical protein